MSLGRIAVRAVIVYLYLLVVTRASGKRVLGQATPFDFLVALILGDLIDDALWAEVPMATFGAVVSSILVCDALTKFGAIHSPAFFHLVNGHSRPVVRDGRVERDELLREQLSEIDLAHLLRREDIDEEHWNDVHLALLERGQDLSVIRRPDAEPATKADHAGPPLRRPDSEERTT
jgi:uncharacterized membrane protein YcaP (DUF421 family)